MSRAGPSGITLARCPAFTPLLDTWPEPTLCSQQGASEFFGHLTRRLAWGSLEGTWGAYYCLQGVWRPQDAGTFDTPLLLPVEDSTACTMQEILDRWSQQAYPRCIDAPPALLPLQIGRFVHEAASDRKIHAAVDGLDRPLLLHCTPDSVESCAYQAQALVLHTGNSPHSGHYRAMVRSGSGWMICDDGQPAVSSGLTPALSREIYLVLCTKLSQAGHGALQPMRVRPQQQRE